jgi:hypothetical protein
VHCGRNWSNIIVMKIGKLLRQYTNISCVYMKKICNNCTLNGENIYLIFWWNSLYYIQSLFEDKMFREFSLGCEDNNDLCKIMYRSLVILHRLTLKTTWGFPFHGSLIVSFICIRFRILNNTKQCYIGWNVNDYFMRTHYGNSALALFHAS